MLWICIGFNANPDPDPAFYLNADPDTDPGSETNADPGGSNPDPDPGKTFESQKVEFVHEKYI